LGPTRWLEAGARRINADADALMQRARSIAAAAVANEQRR
jgi:hypothetical protein